jgi:phosphoribosylformimino-5-aminoimidazole carboxamide ribotide isomerase
MDLYPAIDLRGGRVVNLVQGDFGRETAYRDDPVAVAQEYEAAGAPWIHVVDLDAARGTGHNRELVASIAGSVHTRVQCGGGVRDESAAEALLGVGVHRVVLGTAAVEDPKLVARLAERHPGQVAVGFDHRDGEVRVRGWVEGSGARLLDLVTALGATGAAAVVVTDIGRDGMLAGTDLDGLRALVRATELPVIASGGVGSLDDLRALGGTGVSGVIVGRALYEGAFTVQEAVAALHPTEGRSV